MASPQAQHAGSLGTGDRSCHRSHPCINPINTVPWCVVPTGALALAPNGCRGSPPPGRLPPGPWPPRRASPTRVWALLSAAAAGVTKAPNGGSRPVISRFMS